MNKWNPEESKAGSNYRTMASTTFEHSTLDAEICFANELLVVEELIFFVEQESQLASFAKCSWCISYILPAGPANGFPLYVHTSNET